MRIVDFKHDNALFNTHSQFDYYNLNPSPLICSNVKRVDADFTFVI